MKRKLVLSVLLASMLVGCAGSGNGAKTENVDAEAGKETTEGAAETGDNSGSADNSQNGEETAMTIDSAEIKKGVYKNAISCHDPQIVLGNDGTYYMTGSHQILAKSDDLTNWSYIGNGNNVFSNLFSGDLDAFKYVGKNEEGGYSVWAANTYYNETMQKYVMYFCTTSTYIKSNLCMAVSDEPGGKYEYTDTILYSGFTGSTAEETDIFDVLGADADISEYLKLGGYDNNKWPNCIDPAIFTDTDDRMWMVYGSWSGGIFLLELDPATGKPIHEAKEGDPQAESFDPYFGYRLVGGGHHAIEGPYLTYSPESGYYHLFVSYGGLTSDGGYQIRQFRSENPMGPYVDAAGNTLGDEEDYMNYGLKMMGNYTLPSLSVTYMAPGGQSIFQDQEGNYYITYHQRFDDGTEYHEPRVHRLFLTEDGWFTASPFEFTDDELSGDKLTDVADLNGTIYILDHGISVSNLVNKPVECTVKDGVITGEEIEGTVELTGDSTAKLTINGEEFSGVIIDMADEAGNKTRSISAVGANNHTIWAVSYIK
ncbi:MAG: arabinan endo-1,5-alpha-L-arabinosidase [Butyrivibrio sp.]|nr:arabinan endo-1,5-alpha-L-arabinosidase [Butyrivibrio sp.]